ncbi:MAG: hypothetical protein OHK0024_21280 [Thalassobaculales bacterium]
MLAVNQLAGFGAASSRIAPLGQAIAWTATTAGTGTFARSNGDRTLRISGSVSNAYCVSTTFAVDGAPRYLELIVSAASWGAARYFQLGADESAGGTADVVITQTYGWYGSNVLATDLHQILTHGASSSAGPNYPGTALPVRLGLGLHAGAGTITLWQNGVLLSTLSGGSIATHLAGDLKLRAGLNVTDTRDTYFQVLTSSEALYLPPGYGYV